MYVKAKGLVLRSVPYKDSGYMLTLLTDTLGAIAVSARGAKRKNSPLSSASQLFAFSDMVLFERGGRYTLSEAQVKESFSGLCEDIGRMALASYFAEVLAYTAEDGGGEELLRLSLNCLYALSSGKYKKRLVKAAFELRLASVSGYAPDLYACAACGKELSECTVNPKTGEAFCLSCANPGVLLSQNALLRAKHIINCELKKLLSFSCENEEARALSAFSEGYLLSRLERGFKTLDFYNSTGDTDE